MICLVISALTSVKQALSVAFFYCVLVQGGADNDGNGPTSRYGGLAHCGATGYYQGRRGGGSRTHNK
jgi:hypothetical protein